MFSLIPDCNSRLQYNNQFNLGSRLTQSLNTLESGLECKDSFSSFKHLSREICSKFFDVACWIL